MNRPWIELIPKALHDRVTVLIFLFGGPFLVWYMFFQVRPQIPHNPDYLWLHLAATAILSFNIYGNLFMMTRRDVSARQSCPSLAEKTNGNDNKNFCSKCRITKPERAHHCKICDVCILRRDHHCWFAGYCVGYWNHRYYFFVILYCWITGLYAQIYYTDFVLKTLGTSLWIIPSFLGPHVPWMLGYYNNYEFFVTGVTSIGIFLQLLLTWLLQIQIFQFRHGQMRYEYSKSITKYDQGLLGNIKEIFGDRWYLVWLSPFINSKLTGNGIQFKKKDQ